jgi:hypothetical protein
MIGKLSFLMIFISQLQFAQAGMAGGALCVSDQFDMCESELDQFRGFFKKKKTRNATIWFSVAVLGAISIPIPFPGPLTLAALTLDETYDDSHENLNSVLEAEFPEVDHDRLELLAVYILKHPKKRRSKDWYSIDFDLTILENELVRYGFEDNEIESILNRFKTLDITD